MPPDGSAAGFTVTDTPPILSAQKYHVLTADDFLAADFPPRELILDPWLPSKGLAMIYGPRGIGKTHVTLGCAYAIASGGEFLGWRAPEPRKVIVMDGEMPAVVLQERLSTIINNANIKPPDPEFLPFLPMDLQESGLDLGERSDQATLEQHLSGADVVIVDNISTLARLGRENESESWSPIQEWALHQRRTGRSVVFIHHANKENKQRGTSRREDVLDTVIALRKPENYQADQGARFEVHFEKNRGFYGEAAKAFQAHLIENRWVVSDVADPKMAQVTALAAAKVSLRDIGTETGMSKSSVHRALKKAREEDARGQAINH